MSMDVQRKHPAPRPHRTRADGHQQPAVKGGVREQRWPGTLMAIGVVSLVIDTFTVVRWTLIEPDKLLRLLALLCFIGGLLPYRWVAYRWGMARLEWFLFGLLAV